MFLVFFFSPNVARMISLWGSRQPWLMQHICIMLGFVHSFEPFGQKQGWEWIVAINGLGFVSVRGCEVSLSCRWGSDAVFQSTETLWRWEQGGGRERKKKGGREKMLQQGTDASHRRPPTAHYLVEVQGTSGQGTHVCSFLSSFFFSPSCFQWAHFQIPTPPIMPLIVWNTNISGLTLEVGSQDFRLYCA